MTTPKYPIDIVTLYYLAKAAGAAVVSVGDARREWLNAAPATPSLHRLIRRAGPSEVGTVPKDEDILMLDTMNSMILIYSQLPMSRRRPLSRANLQRES